MERCYLMWCMYVVVRCVRMVRWIRLHHSTSITRHGLFALTYLNWGYMFYEDACCCSR
jgi:hypothetical protein